MLTLGSWNPDVGRAGMTLQYSEPSTDGKALIYMIGSRQDTSWIWNHATATGSTTTPMMLLAGADHSLRLFRPSDSANAAITLNPSGQSYWLNFGPYPDTSAATTVGGTNRTKGIFVVGAGTNATRRNAMRITEDGVVLIQESGDIPMGEFTAGPRP